MRMGIEARPSFTVSQHRRNVKLLEWVQKYLLCGGIRFNTRDQTYKYEVRSLDDLVRYVIPHFEEYPLKSSKREDFMKFKEICELMKSNHHLSQNGIVKIIELAYTMNNFGARRYTKESLLKIVSKMKV